MRYRDYLKHKMALGRVDGTLQAIQNHLRCFWNFYKSKRKKLKTISKRDFEDYLYFLRQKGYKSSTIRDRLGGLRDFLRYKNIKVLPEFKISQPKRLPKFLEYDELKKIREIIKEEMKAINALFDLSTKDKNKTYRYHYMKLEIKERDLLIFDLLLGSGMRTAELCSLNCEDVKEQPSLLILGKGSKERIVEIPENLHLRLKKFIDHRNPDEPLFSCRNGKRITRYAISTFVKRYGKKAKLGKKMSPHKLRHSFATSLLNQGARIEAVSTLLGHANLSTTQIYARLSNQKIREEYTKFKGCLEFK